MAHIFIEIVTAVVIKAVYGWLMKNLIYNLLRSNDFFKIKVAWDEWLTRIGVNNSQVSNNVYGPKGVVNIFSLKVTSTTLLLPGYAMYIEKNWSNLKT